MTSLAGKTILQVIPALETGGAERTTVEIAEAIIAKGGRALVVSSGGALVQTLEQLGATHIELPAHSKNLFTMLLNIRRLKEICRLQGVDIIHARSRVPAWSAYYASRQQGIAFVTTYHGIYTAKGWVKRLYNSVMARGDYVIANSEYTKNQVLKEHALQLADKADKLVTVHRGADLSIFDPAQVTAERRHAVSTKWDRKTEQQQGSFKILLPGRLTAWKGQQVLIEALEQLLKQQKDLAIHAILCGSAQGRDAYQETLQTLIEQAGLAQNVTIVGHEADMAAAYLWADVVLSTSTRPEAFGRVAIEAQAMGRPVIATAHGGAMETVVPGVTGLLVPPGSQDALCAALAQVINMQQDKRDEMGQAANKMARRDFSIDKMADKTLKIYGKILFSNR